MSADDRIQRWIDAVIERSRDHLRSELEQLAAEVAAAERAQQEEAVRAARSVAEEAAAAFTAEAITAERRAADERLSAALDQARQAHETALEQARHGHDAALAGLRGALDQANADAVADLEQRAEEDLASAVTFARADERHAELAAASVLLEAIRDLDGARSLTEVLDGLASHVARHTRRSAVFVVRGGRLKGWRWSGFEGEASSCDAPLEDTGLVAAAVRSGVGQSGTGAAAVTGLAPAGPDHAATAVPVLVDRQVVAAVFADGGGDDARVVPSAWPEIVEVLARHAARCLEAITARRLPDLLRAGAAERVQRTTPAQDEQAAQRCARLLVSEIKLYHEAALDEARAHRDILGRLRPQIERAQQMYAERVPERIRTRTRYFEQELVRTLAGGDPALMGQVT